MTAQPRTEITAAPVLASLAAEVRRLLPTAAAQARRCARGGCKRLAPPQRAYCRSCEAVEMRGSLFAPEPSL